MKDISINKIVIKKLFNKYNYTIDLNNGYNISVLIAPNGCGKTTIFKIIDFIFKPTISGYFEIRNIPFNLVECYLQNGQRVFVERIKRKVRISGYSLDWLSIFRVNESAYLGADDCEYDLRLGIRGKESIWLSEEIVDLHEKHKKINRGYYDFDERYRMPNQVLQNALLFLEKNKCKLTVNYIKADRLHTIRCGKRTDYEYVDMVTIINQKIGTMLEDIIADYNFRQQESKDRLPKMYLSESRNDSNIEFEVFKEEWDSYVSTLEQYASIGLIPNSDIFLKDIELESVFEDNKKFLLVYLEAFRETLKPFSDIYYKLKLFLDILNSRNEITQKHFLYCDKGLKLKCGEDELKVEMLSSGEKNDLIMFYNLIFQPDGCDLVMIDEPEISLHINWQEEYLNRLLNITEMNHIQAMIATHSPHIIGGHFELFAKRGLEI